MSFWERLSHGFRPSRVLLQEHTWTESRKVEEKMKHEEPNRDTVMMFDNLIHHARTPNEIALDKASDLLKLPKHLIENIDNINTSVNEDCITIDISFVGQKVSNKAYLFGSDGSVDIIDTDPKDITDLDSYHPDDVVLAHELITRMNNYTEDSKFAMALITSRQLEKLQKQEGEN